MQSRSLQTQAAPAVFAGARLDEVGKSIALKRRPKGLLSAAATFFPVYLALQRAVLHRVRQGPQAVAAGGGPRTGLQ